MITNDITIENIDAELVNHHWSLPRRTGGAKGGKTCYATSYTKFSNGGEVSQKVSLVKIRDSSGNSKPYIFIDNPKVGITLEDMQLFVKKIESDILI